ncbi:prepilin-type N-terminal cleavage/methylation domain-containing protein [Clostridium sp. BJN0013]|uniref:prepilin-type N-terminal cleavage/methylation domain-containing protein n=1 Tax=Clostridium sp. BJN0013 TaxID=3236840 RepID=UPI0034C5BE21
MNRKNGFTLIEIMIVISIIAILSMILVPKVGAVRLQSKNKSVSTNVLLIRTYLENRAGKDGIYINKNKNHLEEALTNVIKDKIGPEMVSNFFGSNALINPFNNKSSIIYSQGNVINHTSSTTSSVLIYYYTDSLPLNNNSVINSTILPKGTDFTGNAVVVVYSTGYILYGLDYSGKIIDTPYIIKFPPVSLSSGEGSGDENDSDDDTGESNSGNTAADFFEANCFNVFGDSVSHINLGNGDTSMNITDSTYLQGQQIIFKQNTNINGDFNVLGTGTSNSVNTGEGNNNTVKVTGKTNFQGYNIEFNSNLQTYSNVSILGINNVIFDNSNINSQFNNGCIQIQSGKDINFNNGINVSSSSFSAVAGESVNFNNVNGNLNLDNNSSAYVQASKNILFDYNVNRNIAAAEAQAPITMIAGNDFNFENNSADVNIKGKTYLKAGNILNILRNVTLGDTYIWANTFNYGGSNINTLGLNTHVNNFSHENWANLNPNYVEVAARSPELPEAAAPAAPVSEITTTKQMKSIKNNVYSSSYDTTTYPGIAFRIIRGSDTESLKKSLNDSNIDSDVYKVLIIEGNCTIDGTINNWSNRNLVFNNFIIYCTGKMTVENNINSITFNNSAIITKNADIKVDFTMTQLNSNQYNGSIKSKINNICEEYFN